jgi:hypothetical protein
MTGGGDVSIVSDERDGMLRVTVTGPRAGLASVCVSDGSRVRILHASAAIGEATYGRSGDRWVLTSKFDFTLRDTRTGPPSEAAQQEFLASNGWVANASNAGAPKREFTIRLSPEIRFVGVTFLTTAEPMSVSHWPSAMSDDCRAVKVAQGFLTETAAFAPATWWAVKQVAFPRPNRVSQVARVAAQKVSCSPILTCRGWRHRNGTPRFGPEFEFTTSGVSESGTPWFQTLKTSA